MNSSSTRGNGQEPDPRKSLEDFLRFCCREYPARHYMLFILGHGLVVGNDVFLFDEHTDGRNSLTLLELREVLSGFKREIAKDAEFELVSFHSCSVSALEVAYELQGTANYMLASQGPAFVGSWPYRQILIRVFNDLVSHGKNINVKEMLIRIFYYCLYNSADFLLAGYSFDLCLCNLKKVSEIKGPLERLSKALVDGLRRDRRSELVDPLVRNFILLSHWKSQSYWQESYTDLYDFCFCFSNYCDELEKAGGELNERLEAILSACGEVMDVLVKEDPRQTRRYGDEVVEKMIVCSEFAGPAYQYSHGLSVYFPWSQPSRDSYLLREYQKYRLNTELDPSWLTFLNEYLDKTRRETLADEYDGRQIPVPPPNERQRLEEDVASLVYNDECSLSNESALSKMSSQDPTGDECDYPSIKNYPRDTRPRREKKERAGDEETSLPMSDTFFARFQR